MKHLAFPNPGGHASKEDYRSNIVASVMAGVAVAVSTPAQLITDFYKLGGPLDQNQTPACVSHAMAQLIKLWWFLKTGKIVKFSPRFLHILSAWKGALPSDGRDPITVAKMAMQFGCATEATCPNDTSLTEAQYFNFKITPAMYAEALQYKIPGYTMIPVTQQDFRAAINKYGAISMLFRIGPEWWTAKNGKASWAQADIDPLRPPHNDVVGGHQLVGMGFRTNIERLLNHWSADWADGGESDYLFNEQKPYIVEALAIAEVPNDTLKLVQSLPAPNDFKHNFAVDLKYGQNNFETRALQIALAIDGWANFEEITGYYGTVTANAVLAFQLKYNVAPTSELNQLKGRSVGPATRKQLNLLFNK